MRAALIAAAGAAAAAAFIPAAAQIADPDPGIAAERIVRVTVYGNEPCPVATGDEIVICARRPDNERYRIPEPLRDEAVDDPEGVSWAARAQSLERVGETGIQSCSTVGPAGHTGCLMELIRAARNERGRTYEDEPGR